MFRKVRDNIYLNYDEKKGLKFMFQPIYLPKEERIFGYECLLRIMDEKLGLITPRMFFPAIKEDDTIMHSIQSWSVTEIFKVVRALDEKNTFFPMLSLNIETEHFLREDFVDEIRALVGDYIQYKNNVYFELKQEAILRGGDEALDKMEYLQSLGIKIAIDDVGDNFDRIKRLGVLPVDMLKIQKSHIDKLLTDKSEKKLIASIIEYALVNDFDLVAMGVESEQQEVLLPQMGCFKMQGYYYSKPLQLRKLVDEI